MSGNQEQKVNTPNDPIENAAELSFCKSTGKPVTISYHTFGDPSNPCLLAINGFMCQSVYFDSDTVKMFVDAGFYVVRYDNRDVGKSTYMDGHGSVSLVRLHLPEWMAWGERVPYTLFDMADDGYRLLKHLKIDKAHVWGISMGGMIAQCLALSHPEVIRSLSLVMTSTSARDLPAMSWKVFFAMLSSPKSLSKEDAHNYRLALIRDHLSGGEKLDDADLTIIKDVAYQCIDRGDSDGGFLRQVAAIKRAKPLDDLLKKNSFEDNFPPTFILHGAVDFLIRVEHGQRLRDCINGSEYLELQYMGHYMTARVWGDAFPQMADFMKKH